MKEGGIMLEYFYQWLQNIAFYLVIITAVIQMIPNNSYKKYIRFFTGLILILMMAEPFMQAVGMGKTFSELYDNAEYRQEIRRIEEKTKYLNESLVEEIQIGNED